MHYRVFYFFERSGESVSSGSAVTMSARDIREQLLGRLHCEDDFLGIIDGQENVLQVLCEPGGDRFWVELPVDAAKASFGCYMERDAVRDLLDSLPEVFERESLPALQYKPW